MRHGAQLDQIDSPAKHAFKRIGQLHEIQSGNLRAGQKLHQQVDVAGAWIEVVASGGSGEVKPRDRSLPRMKKGPTP